LRTLEVLGLIGGPVVFASNVAVMAGAYPQTSVPAGVGAVTVFGWETSLAAYLIVKGFRGGGAGASRSRRFAAPASLAR